MRGLWIASIFFACGGGGGGGTSPRDGGTHGDARPCVEYRDLDADGFRDADCGGDDCDDSDPAIHPDAVDDVWSRERMSVPSLVEWNQGPVLGLRGDSEPFFVFNYGGVPDGQVYVSWEDGGAWTGQQFGLSYWGADLHVATSGAEARIAYLDDTDSLAVATFAGTDWSLETTPFVSLYDAGIALDGDVLSALVSHGNDVSYGTDAGGTLATEVVHDCPSRSCTVSLDVDGAGTAHALFWDRALEYATNATGSFEWEPIDGEPEPDPDLVVSEDGTPHVFYWGVGDPDRLEYVTRDGTGWREREIVVESGTVLRGWVPAIDPTTGDAWVPYSAGDTITIIDATDEAVAPIVYTTDFYFPDFASIAFDAGGRLHLLVRTNPDDPDVQLALLGLDGIDQNCDGVDGE